MAVKPYTGVIVRKTKAAAPPPKTLSQQVAAAVERALGKLTDDLYNAAIAQNPSAFATTQGRDAVVTVADAGEITVMQNDLLVPMAVVVRADGDVLDVLLSTANCAIGDKQVRGFPQVEAILHPRQTLYANVRAAVYPCRLIVTAIPMQGRRTVFGGSVS